MMKMSGIMICWSLKTKAALKNQIGLLPAEFVQMSYLEEQAKVEELFFAGGDLDGISIRQPEGACALRCKFRARVL